MAITAGMVKELREMTGAGMMDCKKALTECDGDMDAAVEVLRKSGAAKAEKKASRIAAEGIAKTAISADSKTGAVVEVNSETDFVAKNEKFQNYVAEVAKQVLTTEATDVDALAIAIGNAHGDYPFPPKLDLERLDEINAITDVPLVLHGGSGIPEDQLAEAFSRGINKFNYGTDTMHCYNDAVLAYHKAHEPAGSNDMIGEAEFVQKAITDFLAKKLDLVKL